jgi:hypothetical protein
MRSIRRTSTTSTNKIKYDSDMAREDGNGKDHGKSS